EFYAERNAKLESDLRLAAQQMVAANAPGNSKLDVRVLKAAEKLLEARSPWKIILPEDVRREAADAVDEARAQLKARPKEPQSRKCLISEAPIEELAGNRMTFRDGVLHGSRSARPLPTIREMIAERLRSYRKFAEALLDRASVARERLAELETA